MPHLHPWVFSLLRANVKIYWDYSQPCQLIGKGLGSILSSTGGELWSLLMKGPRPVSWKAYKRSPWKVPPIWLHEASSSWVSCLCPFSHLIHSTCWGCRYWVLGTGLSLRCQGKMCSDFKGCRQPESILCDSKAKATSWDSLKGLRSAKSFTSPQLLASFQNREHTVQPTQS